MNYSLLGRLALCVVLLVPVTSWAQQPCGEIESINPNTGEVTHSPVQDCDNPFTASVGLPEGVTLLVYGTEIAAASTTVQVPDDEISLSAINLTLPPRSSFAPSIYRQVGADYKQVGPEFWGDSEAALPLGTYVFVFTEQVFCVSDRGQSWWRLVREVVIPTAHAQAPCELGYVPEVYAVTVTFTQQAAKPTGASSVLFLPGIQASRLYKEGLLGSEDQLWTPTNVYSQDIRQLALNSNGQSVNDVYTRDVLDQVPGVGSIYGELLGHLDDLVADEVVTSYRAFAYDWRFSPDTIVQTGVQYEGSRIDLVDIVSVLAAEAASGQVTIIAHSNGGLVAKALVAELEKRNKADLIDRIVFIGTPHIGTPKAVGTVLHGYDQAVSVTRLEIPVIEADAAREVINNMPGAYGLLPSPAYFAASPQPVVSIEPSPATAALHDAYGVTIDDHTEFTAFLHGDDDLDRRLSGSISVPVTVNESLHDAATTEHTDLLDTWVAPPEIEVAQIVGVGLPTLRAVEYRQVIEDECAVISGGQIVCVPRGLLKPFGYFSNDGDETVMSISAQAYAGASEVYYINMENVEQSDTFQSSHSSLTESSEVLVLLENILQATTSDEYSYISQAKPTISTNYDIEIFDSPVSALATDAAGNQTGVTEENGKTVIVTDIPGSQYVAFGDTKYLIIPSDVDREVVLTGEAAGGYTLTLATLGNDNQTTINSVLSNATVTPTMRVVYTKTAAGYSTLQTDLDGDGGVDFTMTPDGMVLSEAIDMPLPEDEPEATAGSRASATRVADRAGVQLAAPTPQVLGLNTLPEGVGLLLQQLSEVLKQQSSLPAEQADSLRQVLEDLQVALTV